MEACLTGSPDAAIRLIELAVRKDSLPIWVVRYCTLPNSPDIEPEVLTLVGEGCQGVFTYTNQLDQTEKSSGQSTNWTAGGKIFERKEI